MARATPPRAAILPARMKSGAASRRYESESRPTKRDGMMIGFSAGKNDAAASVPTPSPMLPGIPLPNSQLQSSAGLGLSPGYVYAAVPAAAFLILLPMASNLVAALRALWQKPS